MTTIQPDLFGESDATALRYCRRMDAMDCAEAMGLVKS